MLNFKSAFADFPNTKFWFPELFSSYAWHVTASRYLDDILNINNVYFDNMVVKYTSQSSNLIKINTSNTKAAFLDLHLSISYDIVEIYDKRDDFDFEIVNVLFLDGDFPSSTSYGVYISQLIRFARASSHVTDFNTRINC